MKDLKEIIANLSYEKVKEIISEIESNYKTMPNQLLLERIKELTIGAFYNTTRLAKRHWYRIVKNDGDVLFTKKSRVWYPPNNLCRIGRMNLPGQPLLYLADSIKTALNETNPQNGTYFSILTCELPEGLNLFSLGIKEGITNPEGFEKSYWHNIHLKKIELTKINKDYLKIDAEIHDYLNGHLRRVVNVGEELNYIFSSIYASHALESNYEGIIYPSVSRELTALNCVVKPLIADEKVSLVHVDVFRMNDSQNKVFSYVNGASRFLGDEIMYDMTVGIYPDVKFKP